MQDLDSKIRKIQGGNHGDEMFPPNAAAAAELFDKLPMAFRPVVIALMESLIETDN